MTKDLNAVIRLHKYIVDEKRRELGALLGQVRALEDQAENLELEIVIEQRAADEAPEEAGFLYGPYAASAVGRRQHLKEATAEIEEKIAIAQEDMRAEFKELKVFEITKEARDDIAEKELAREEQNVLDELGLDRHRRQKKGIAVRSS